MTAKSFVGGKYPGELQMNLLSLVNIFQVKTPKS